MKVATRTAHLAGITTRPNEVRMKPIARNLTDCCDGFLLGTRHLLMDRDGSFSEAFRAMLKNAGGGDGPCMLGQARPSRP